MRLLALFLLSAGCAVAPPVLMPEVQPPDSLRMAALRHRALALAREKARAGFGSGSTCPMPIIRADTAVAPMTVFRPDSSRRHTILVIPPGCRSGGI
jgi:hypothetical protein